MKADPAHPHCATNLRTLRHPDGHHKDTQCNTFREERQLGGRRSNTTRGLQSASEEPSRRRDRSPGDMGQSLTSSGIQRHAEEEWQKSEMLRFALHDPPRETPLRPPTGLHRPRASPTLDAPNYVEALRNFLRPPARRLPSSSFLFIQRKGEAALQGDDRHPGQAAQAPAGVRRTQNHAPSGTSG